MRKEKGLAGFEPASPPQRCPTVRRLSQLVKQAQSPDLQESLPITKTISLLFTPHQWPALWRVYTLPYPFSTIKVVYCARKSEALVRTPIQV